jgi:hypothetical protein
MTDVLYCPILLCLTPGDFICQAKMLPLNGLIRLSVHASWQWPMHPTLFFLLCLTPDDSARQEESAVTQWVNLSYSIPINIEFACVMLL